MHNLSDIARATASAHPMFSDESIVLAMVSGGADSVALLRLLAAGEFGQLTGLSAMHVNHGLRGSDADADEAFVTALCADLGVPCDVVRYDVAGYARAGQLNLEDAGRRVRYSFAEAELDSRCAALGVRPALGRVAVAHTFDDRLETLLARLVAGSGGAGLRSIAPVRGRVVRPLIDARRADVTAYLRGLGQDWREDATNADTSRQRAWVRHELLPAIERRNPSFDAAAARMLAILSDDDDLLTGMADAFAHDFTRVEGGALVLDRALMRTLSRAMARRTVRSALVAAFPEASRLEFEHTEALVDGLACDSFARDLPFGLRAEGEYGTLRISRRAGEPACVTPALLSLPGSADLGASGTMVAEEAPRDVLATGPDRVTIDADAARWPLVVDAMREGDRMRPLGMDGTRKLSDVLAEAKVPRRLRAGVPVVRDGDRIVWVAGVRLAEEYRVTSATRRVAELAWSRSAATGGSLDERLAERSDDEPSR